MHTYTLNYRRFLQAVIFLLTPAFVFAQQSAADSLRTKFQKDSAHIYRFKEVSFLFSFDRRSTFIATPENDFASFGVFGLKAGLMFNERHKAGLGLYTLRTPRTKGQQAAEPNETLQLTFNYMSLFYEYLFIRNRWWNIGLPVEAGLGRYKLAPINPPAGTPPPDRVLAVPTGVALNVHFKPIRWVSINGMGGYRYVVNTNSSVDLSNWFYALGLSLSLRHMSEDTRYYLKKRKYHKDLAHLQAPQLQ